MYNNLINYLNETFYYAAAAAAMASAVFCSCDKQDEVTPPQPEIAPVHFVGVTTLDVVTRAEAKPYAADFNVFIPGVTAATKLVKYSADAWTVEGDPIWWIVRAVRWWHGRLRLWP